MEVTSSGHWELLRTMNVLDIFDFTFLCLQFSCLKLFFHLQINFAIISGVKLILIKRF